jgi:hypothetical protein
VPPDLDFRHHIIGSEARPGLSCGWHHTALVSRSSGGRSTRSVHREDRFARCLLRSLAGANVGMYADTCRPGIRCNPTIETGAGNKCWIATGSNTVVWVVYGRRWTNLDYENFVQEAELIRTSRTKLLLRGGTSKGTPRDRESNQNTCSYWLENCW